MTAVNLDLTKPGTPIDVAKLRTVGVMGDSARRATRPIEGIHPESGLKFKTTVADDNGSTITEHTQPGSGVSVRQDVDVHLKTVHYNLAPKESS